MLELPKGWWVDGNDEASAAAVAGLTEEEVTQALNDLADKKLSGRGCIFIGRPKTLFALIRRRTKDKMVLEWVSHLESESNDSPLMIGDGGVKRMGDFLRKLAAQNPVLGD